jgi:hypothetical protein
VLHGDWLIGAESVRDRWHRAWSCLTNRRHRILAPTTARLERDVAKALTNIASERIVAISYAVSRIFGVVLQHHALIVSRGA